MPERNWPTDEKLVDLMIDLMAELEAVETSARRMRERLAMISVRMQRGMDE